jgi:hypothetical protein
VGGASRFGRNRLERAPAAPHVAQKEQPNGAWTPGRRHARISRMKERSERDPVLRLIDAVLGDLAVRSEMYIGRRREDGGDESFVLQTGEDGRLRLALPDRASDASIEGVVAEAQAYLGDVLGAPVPLCPRHHHPLVGSAAHGRLTWVCPEGSWQCALGDYEELTWPQDDVASLAHTCPETEATRGDRSRNCQYWPNQARASGRIRRGGHGGPPDANAP